MNGYRELAAGGFSYAFEGERLHHERSQYQLIEVYENEGFGRILVLDGLTQTSTRDEFTYHEMLVHVPLVNHPAPRRVLVIGGGDGGTLRRVLMHPTVEKAVNVEIDGRVVDVSLEYLPEISAGAFDDPRAELIVGDGFAYLAEEGEPFDVILVDSSDPVGPGVVLFTPDFYASVRRRLAPGGVFAAQSGGPLYQQAELNMAFNNTRTAFPDARLYLGVVPIYPGTLWSYLHAGDATPVGAEEAGRRAADRGLVTRFWTPEVHEACFALPAFVRDVIAPDGPPRTFGPSAEELSRRA